jgi:hypothetical protein
MLSFLKKIFGSTPAETPAPYKVESPVVEAPKSLRLKRKQLKKASCESQNCS